MHNGGQDIHLKNLRTQRPTQNSWGFVGKFRSQTSNLLSHPFSFSLPGWVNCEENNCHMLNCATMLKCYFDGLSEIEWIIQDLWPKTVNKYHTGRWAGYSDPPLSQIPAWHLFVSGQHSVLWAFLAYWHPAAEYSTHNALQQAPAFIAKPCHAMLTHMLYFCCFNEKWINLLSMLVVLVCASEQSKAEMQCLVSACLCPCALIKSLGAVRRRRNCQRADWCLFGSLQTNQAK